MCVQPEPAVAKQEETIVWIVIQRPMNRHDEDQSMASHTSESQDTLHGLGCDPMARWMRESPVDSSWHDVQECRLVEDVRSAEPKNTSVPSSMHAARSMGQ
ncbi:hypothetical protein VSDG_08481 [Cytospora chrysosperma]|uniref:Uncharacterized protein n=1 Tax=Cytospora chrysosperma TaxID=252740 RepID=A0A423VHF8_CYTCH|nr:hypothetical protein VSDG_08481 [Valsa sordida]